MRAGCRGLKLAVRGVGSDNYGSRFSFNPAKLAGVAVAAYKKAFSASLDVGGI